MGRVTNYIIIALIFLGVALIGTFLYNFQQLIDYKSCMNQPITELSQHCKEVINADF
jgi:hypothetical protein